MSDICRTCGQLQGIEEYDEALWDVYYRIRDRRSMYEPLVFDSQWLQENVMDEEDERAVVHAMEKDMHNRGLCITCGRPDLHGVKPEDIVSKEEAEALHEMWAEREAERRAGCG